MASPGLIAWASKALRSFDRPVVCSLGWHLGPSVQYETVSRGYSQVHEDALLASVDWEKDGYRLFEISSIAGSSKPGFFLPLRESNALFCHRDLYVDLGGYDEAFTSPGGGFANLDFLSRACERDGVTLVNLLGEGTFHQFHNGVTTGAQHESTVAKALVEYQTVRGRSFAPPVKTPVLVGHMPISALKSLRESVAALSAHRGKSYGASPLEELEQKLRNA